MIKFTLKINFRNIAYKLFKAMQKNYATIKLLTVYCFFYVMHLA